MKVHGLALFLLSAPALVQPDGGVTAVIAGVEHALRYGRVVSDDSGESWLQLTGAPVTCEEHFLVDGVTLLVRFDDDTLEHFGLVTLNTAEACYPRASRGPFSPFGAGTRVEVHVEGGRAWGRLAIPPDGSAEATGAFDVPDCRAASREPDGGALAGLPRACTSQERGALLSAFRVHLARQGARGVDAGVTPSLDAAERSHGRRPGLDRARWCEVLGSSAPGVYDVSISPWACGWRLSTSRWGAAWKVRSYVWVGACD